MSDLKSKLPDFKEVTSMATKLFKDVKTSVSEIIGDYKKKRAEEAAAAEAEAAKAPKTEATVEEKPKAPAAKKAKEKTAEKDQEKPEDSEKQ